MHAPVRSRVRLLGIDPGSRVTGFGVIDMDGSRAVHVASGCIVAERGSLAERLKRICEGVVAVVEGYRPLEAAVEMVFMSRNADSALKLGQARGAAIVALALRGLPVYEFTPAQIKQAIVGRGGADKAQVQHMIRALLCLRAPPAADAADALAVAITHGHTRQGLLGMSAVRGVRGGRLQ